MTRRKASFEHTPTLTTVDVIALTILDFTKTGKKEDYISVAKVILDELDAFRTYQIAKKRSKANEIPT